MSAYVPHNTSRLKLHYQAAGRQHTVQFRGDFTTEATATALANNVKVPIHDFMVAFGPTDAAWISAEYALKDSDVFLPLVGFTGGTMAGTGSALPNVAAIYATAVGRSSSGRRARLTLYGVSGMASTLLTTGIMTDFRVTGAENADVNGYIAALNALALGAIDGTGVGWRNYVDVGVSSYYTKKARRGA